jgi:VWFA-related protein
LHSCLSRFGFYRLALGVAGAMVILGPLGAFAPAAGAMARAARAASVAPPDARGTFSESTDVTVVQVPVQVVRAGEPVRGLTAADFEVYDGKNRQKVTGFEVLDLAARQGPVAAIPPVLRRHFLLLFDLSFSEPKSLLKARQMMREALPSLHPSDLVAVATYSSADGPRLVVGFTSDRRQVLTAIDRLGLTQLVDRNPDPLKLMVGREELAAGGSMSAVEQGDAGSRARAGGGTGATAQHDQSEAEMIDILQGQARVADTADRQQQQAVIGAFARSFTDLARLMAGIHGRKEVIYFSEGFDTSLLQGVESQEQREHMADLGTHGEAYLTDSNTRYGDTRGGNVLERMLEELRRSDCVIQAVDIGGLRTQGDAGPLRRSGEGSLFAMAHDTGGELYRNFNDLGAAMAQLLHKTSLTYVLTFQPDAAKPDGSYHQLRVALRNTPAASGAQVSYRPGYYAPRPYRQQSAGERQLSAAEAVVGGGDSGVLRTAVLAVPLRRSAAAGKVYVPVVIETDGASLLNGSPGESLALEVYAYAIDSSGAIEDFFGQRLRFELAKVIPLLDRTGLKFFGRLDLPPGEYNVRVLVRNAANGDYGLRNQSLVVPAFDQRAPVLLPPFFPEVPERWLMVRQAPRGGQQEAPYPFVVREKIYVPALRPVLAPAQQVAVALMGYNLPVGDLKATARVVSAQGVDLGVGDFTIDGREPPDPEGTERLTATFRPPRGLEPGEYQLVIELTDAQGVAHDSATRFLVAPAGPHGAHG